MTIIRYLAGNFLTYRLATYNYNSKSHLIFCLLLVKRLDINDSEASFFLSELSV